MILPTDAEMFIKILRYSDRHIESIFTMGGCYRFCKLLDALFDGADILISAKGDHAATRINGKVYDITGEVSADGFRNANNEDIEEMELWSFDRHHMLAVGECPLCEEPISPTAGGDK